MLNFQQFESKMHDPFFEAVFLSETDELIAFFDEVDFADMFIVDEMSSSDAVFKIEDQMRSEGMNEWMEEEEWEEEVEKRFNELRSMTYDIRELDMNDLIHHLTRLDKRKRDAVFNVSDSEHINRDRIEKMIRGKGLFGI